MEYFWYIEGKIKNDFLGINVRVSKNIKTQQVERAQV